MLLVLLVALAPLPVLAGPRISFDRDTHDYGKVLHGETVTEEFNFTNTGDQTLIIEELRSSCGCTKAIKGSSEVPPQGKSTIVAAFDTTGLSPGRKMQHLYVHSNDTAQPVVKLTLLANVVRELNVDPPTLAKHLESFSEVVSFPMRIVNSSDKPYTVTGVKGQTDGIEATLQPARLLVKPGAKEPFAVSLKLKKEPGRHYYMGKFFLLTDHPKEKEMELRYLMKIDKAD